MEQIKNNDLFKTIFNSVPNGIAVMKFVYNDKNEIEDFLILMLNAYNRDLLGDIDYNEQLYSKVFPASKNNGILQKFIETAQTGIVSNFDQWYEDENRKQWFRFIAVKQADLLVVTTEDITEKKQAEIRLTNALEAAEKQRRLYSSITNNTPDLVYVFDLNYNFTYANKALLKMWGKSAKDAIGKGLRDNGYEEWHALLHEREIDEIVATKKMIRSTVSFPHAELGKRIYDYILTPVFNEQGIVEAVAGITRDITEIKLSEQKRELSERRLKSMIEQTPAPTLVLKGDDLVIEQINEHMLKMIGRGKEIIGMPLIDVLPELKGQYVWEQVKNVYNKGISFDQSEVLVPHNRTGKICDYYYNLAYRPLIDDGQITGMIQVAVDVTEQVVARKKLEESENRFRALINASSDVVYYINADWTVMSNLDNGFLSGHSNSVSNWLNKYIHPLDKEKVSNLITESILNKSIFELEHRILNADGSIGWIFSRVVPILDHDNEVIEWFGTSSDITSQKEIQEVIKESEEKFRQLADMVPQIIWTSEPNGFVNYYNKRWYEYTNSKETELGDVSWYSLLHPDDAANVEKVWYKSIKGADSYQVEFRLKNANTGQYRWFLGQGLPVKDKNGVITKWFGTCTDIHEQKTITEKLEILVAERTKELQRSNEDLQQFAHVASHDLKEPVRKIKTFTSRLEEYYKGDIDETAAKFIERIHVAADRMFNMIDGVLAYSKINANLRQSTLVDLNEVIKNIEIDLEVALQRSNGTIKYDHLPTIEGAAVLLYQLFYNLINNSIKFAKDNIAPEIILTSEIDTETNTVIITLKDNGIGFSSDQSDLIFETFSRLHPKDKYEGTGLGLSLCKKIAERHGGKITASGSNANGAEFIITLPLKQNENDI